MAGTAVGVGVGSGVGVGAGAGGAGAGAGGGAGAGAGGGAGPDGGAEIGAQAPSKITLMARNDNINRFISVFLTLLYLDMLQVKLKKGTGHRHQRGGGASQEINGGGCPIVPTLP